VLHVKVSVLSVFRVVAFPNPPPKGASAQTQAAEVCQLLL
jgi:hypothetical protein